MEELQDLIEDSNELQRTISYNNITDDIDEDALEEGFSFIYNF